MKDLSVPDGVYAGDKDPTTFNVNAHALLTLMTDTKRLGRLWIRSIRHMWSPKMPDTFINQLRLVIDEMAATVHEDPIAMAEAVLHAMRRVQFGDALVKAEIKKKDPR